jgi:predicted nucleotidyltransferase
MSSMPVTAKETALHLQSLEADRRRRGSERAARLLSHAAEAKRLLRECYAARQVWLFGSLAAGQPTVDSDVDLAVEGLPSAVYFNALADLMSLFQGPVDLVRLEEAPDSLRDRILSEGREL